MLPPRGAFLVLVALVVGMVACSTAPRARDAASATQDATSASTSAQRIADQLVEQAQGKATAAAYVETTYGRYVAILPVPDRPLPSSAPDDDVVLVIKIFGAFTSGRRGIGAIGEDTSSTAILAVYDETLDRLVEASYDNSPPGEDVTGVPDPAHPHPYADLRLLGTPHKLRTQ